MYIHMDARIVLQWYPQFREEGTIVETTCMVFDIKTLHMYECIPVYVNV